MKLTKIMKEKKITTQALSDMTGINKRTIESYRANRIEPSFITGLIIAKALELDPYDLLEDGELDSKK